MAATEATEATEAMTRRRNAKAPQGWKTREFHNVICTTQWARSVPHAAVGANGAPRRVHVVRADVARAKRARSTRASKSQ